MKERFTVQLAIMDAIPVLLFSASAIALAGKIRQPLFVVGAILCVCAGLGKVIWKLVLALGGKDIAFLGAQLRYVMPAGFLLMIIGAVLSEMAGALLGRALKMPSVLFFAIAVIGIILMFFCARRFDRKNVRGNWIEQTINCVAQAAFLAGVLLL